MRMRTWFLMSFIVFPLCMGVIASSLAQENLTAIVKKIEPSVVVLITYDNTGKAIGQGSGFFISEDGHVITNRHVLERANRAEVKIVDGKVFNIKKVIGEDEDGDLIRVSTDAPSKIIRPLSISGSIPEIGERVIAIGSPLGLERTVTDGIVSAIRETLAFGGKVIQITAPISPGSSGSPVVNLKGEVIGVATFQISEGQNLNFVIPGERVTRLKSGKERSLASWEAQRAEESLASAVELKSKGIRFFQVEDYGEALIYFKRAVKKNPKDDEAYWRIGLCYGKIDRHQEAVEYFKMVVKLRPNLAEAYFNMGLAYGRLGRYQEAIEAFKEGIRIKPNDAQAHNFLGMTYGRLGRRHEAVEAFKRAVSVKPDYIDAHINLSKAYARFGRYQEALESCKEAIRINPSLPEAHRGLGIIYSRLGRYQEAIAAFREALLIKPDFAEAHLSRGLNYFLMGNHDKSLEDYNRAIELKPDYAIAFSNRGYLYLDLEKYQSAIKDFQKAIELDRDKESPYIGLSIISFRQKKIEEAKKYYQKAIEIEPICKDGADALELEKGSIYTQNEKRTINEILKLF